VIEPLVAVRAIHLAATTVAAGMVFFALVIAGPVVGARDKAAKAYFGTLDGWIWAALTLALISGVAWAVLIAMQLGGAGAFATLLSETRFGHVWMARGLLAVAMAVTLLAGRLAWLGAIAAALLLAALALVGHSGAGTGAIGYARIGADIAHLLAAGLWLGSLPALALLLRRKLSSSAAVTRRFSRFGMVAVATLLITGLINTFFLTDSVAALVESNYGRILLVKIGLFAAMVGLATVNRWHWTPKLPENRARTAIFRQSLFEIALGMAVLLCVGLLGTMPPPLHRHSHSGQLSENAAFVHIHDVRAMADVTVRPAQREIQIRLMKEDFTPLPANAVSVRLSRPGERNVIAGLRNEDAGLWRATDVPLRTMGGDTVWVTVTTVTGERIVLDAPIVLGSAPPAKSQ
jgi:putative copper resistance protein D